MGSIAAHGKAERGTYAPQTPEQSRQTWTQIFGTDKETSQTKPRESLVGSPNGGSWGRSNLATEASFKRLLQAMRSLAPGGWSDDRWEQSKHFYGIQYMAIHRKCELMSQAEFEVFVKDDNHPDGKRPVQRYEPAYDLVKLLEKPNREDSFGDLMYRWGQQMDMTGKALTWMVPNMLGTPHELYSIPTALAIPQPAVNPDFPDGYYRIQPVYPYGPFSSYPTPTSAVGAPIPAQWMIEFKYPHPLLRYDGYSPYTALRMHIDEVEAMDRSRWYKMKRSVIPEAVLQYDDNENPMPLDQAEIERIRAEFEAQMQGEINHGKLFVATPGARLEPWGQSVREMDYPHSWDQLVAFVLAGFGITRPAAGMVDDAAYSTLFATLKQLYVLTLDPQYNRIAQRLTRRLAPFFGDNLIIEIRGKRIDDHDLRNQMISLGMQTGVLKKNEVRKMLDLEPTKEAWGEDFAGSPSALPGKIDPATGLMTGPDGNPIMPEAGAVDPTTGQPLPPEAAPGQPQPQVPDEVKAEPTEIAASRPEEPGLEGAYGPMKSLNGYVKSSPSTVLQLLNSYGTPVEIVLDAAEEAGYPDVGQLRQASYSGQVIGAVRTSALWRKLEQWARGTPAITTKIVKRDGEWIVRVYEYGVLNPNRDYFTNDREDAQGTARAIEREGKSLPSKRKPLRSHGKALDDVARMADALLSYPGLLEPKIQDMQVLADAAEEMGYEGIGAFRLMIDRYAEATRYSMRGNGSLATLLREYLRHLRSWAQSGGNKSLPPVNRIKALRKKYRRSTNGSLNGSH